MLFHYSLGLVMDFQQQSLLIRQPLQSACRASVVIPARDEERSLPATLDALRLQQNVDGSVLDPNSYEVQLLLNNCTDDSAALAHRYSLCHPAFRLHVVEASFARDVAHVGTARRLLMDTAWRRLDGRSRSAILSTDADTVVAPTWIACNLDAMRAGAEVVGGVIHLNPGDIQMLDPGTLHAYRQDLRYQRRVAHIESMLDPDAADPWPRHLAHFGASLACTPAVYARAGGMPPIRALEDVAFVDSCRRVDARIRHAPEVSVTTSARLAGRAEIGLSGQLRRWQGESATNGEHLVQSAAYLVHRFTTLARLRRLRTLTRLPPMHTLPPCWREPLCDVHPLHLAPSSFLCAVDCDRLIEETFEGRREDRIQLAIMELDRAIGRVDQREQTGSRVAYAAASTEAYVTFSD